MTDLNHVCLLGNLVRDIGTDEKAFGYSANGSARANFTVAVNRSVKKGEEWNDEANFFDVVLWGKSAENLKPYLNKGQRVVVDGYLKQERWEKDGEKKSRIIIVANQVQLVGGKKDSNNAAAVNNQQPVNEQNFDSGAGFQEDIPF